MQVGKNNVGWRNKSNYNRRYSYSHAIKEMVNLALKVFALIYKVYHMKLLKIQLSQITD